MNLVKSKLLELEELNAKLQQELEDATITVDMLKNDMKAKDAANHLLKQDNETLLEEKMEVLAIVNQAVSLNDKFGRFLRTHSKSDCEDANTNNRIMFR